MFYTLGSENGKQYNRNKKNWVVVVKAIRLRVLTTLLGCIKQKRVGTQSLICSFYNSMFFFSFYYRAEIPIYIQKCLYLIHLWFERSKKEIIYLKIIYIVWLPSICKNTSNRQFIQNGGWICEQLFAVWFKRDTLF